VKLAANDGRSDDLLAVDFVLKREHLEMLSQFSRLGNGTVLSLEVRRGLPAMMTLGAGPADLPQ
jgi:hypothetical protein